MADADAETVTLSDAQLADWARAAAPVTARVGIAVDEGDARWLWLAALMLVLLEGWVRRAPGQRAREEKDVVHADAA
jgi:MYXO-CTERM domain-containing protein